MEADHKDKRDLEYRHRILAAARKLLALHSYDTVNMYQVAQEAGIGQGTLYRRYHHLGEIYSDLLRTSVEQFLGELEGQQDKGTSTLSALDQLDEAIVSLVNYIDDNVLLLSTINCRYAGRKNFLPHQRPITMRLHTIFSSLLERVQGGTKPFDVTLMTNFLMAALAPEQYLHHRDTHGYSKDRYLAGIRRLFVEGLQ